MSCVILSIGIDGSNVKPKATHVGMVAFGKKHAMMVPVVFPQGKTHVAGRFVGDSKRFVPGNRGRIAAHRWGRTAGEKA